MGLTGKEAEKAIEKAGITVNENTTPFDERPPLAASYPFASSRLDAGATRSTVVSE
jgi:hypothetical protein